MTTVRVAIVDVGANTLRLLVATRDRDGRVDALSEDKRQLGLGEEIERNGGRIRAEKLEQAAEVARLHVRRARKLNADAIEILVTSPGRQAVNGDELVQALSAATGAPVTVLSAEAEGELGWLGVDRARARTLTAGTIVLSELQRRLGMPLRVARGGIREGAAFELLAGRLSATG